MLSVTLSLSDLGHILADWPNEKPSAQSSKKDIRTALMVLVSLSLLFSFNKHLPIVSDIFAAFKKVFAMSYFQFLEEVLQLSEFLLKVAILKNHRKIT